MRTVNVSFMVVLISAFGATEALADCQVADARLEEAIQQNPRLRGPANSQAVHDLRSLRDAAITLGSYGRHEDCERLLAIANSSRGRLWGPWEITRRERLAEKSLFFVS
jgi:hypothetical protein